MTVPGREWLIVRAGTRVCALPVADVLETMRPLPVAPLAGAPPGVLGSAVVRGEALPVIHAGVLIGEERSHTGRFVTLRIAQRRVALAVDAVVGLRRFDVQASSHIPPLLAGALGDAVTALRVADEDLMLVLDGARLVPPDVWDALDTHHARSTHGNAG